MVKNEKNLSEFLTVYGNGSLKTATILVVDEDPVECLRIQSQLKERYLVNTAHNGTDALSQIHKSHPSLILCSSSITAPDHVSLLHALKKDPATEHIPVILLSGRDSPGEVEVCDTQADDYLIKPFSNKELVARIATQLKIISRRENAKRQVKNLFVQAPVAICIFRGPEHVVELANESMLGFWGRDLGQVLNKPVFECLPDLGGQGVEGLLDTVYKTGERFVTPEVPLTVMRNGQAENVFIKLTYEAMRDEDETISGVMAVAYEITDQILARQKLEESEAFNRTVLESSPDCLKVIDEGGRLQFMNHNGLCALEIDDFATYKNRQWWEMWGEQNQELVKDAVRKSLGGETAYFQAVDFTVKGTQKWWDVIVSPVLEEGVSKKVSHIIAVSRDITEQKQAALKLKESEKRFRNLVEKSPSPILILKGEDMIMEVANQPVLTIFNVDESSLGKPLMEVKPEMKGQFFMEWLTDVYQNGVTHYGNEEPVYFIRESGEKDTFYFNFVYQAYREDDGAISGVMVTASNVTEQVNARKKIENSEHRYQELVYSSPSMIAILKGQEMVVDIANDAILETWGKGKDVFGKSLLDVMPELVEQGFDDIFRQVYTTGISHYGYNVPVEVIRNGKTELSYYTFVYQPQRNVIGEIDGLAIICTEVTPQAIAGKIIEESEAHLRKMSELMPAKITHANADGSVTYCNESWLDFTGRDFEEFKSFGYYNVMHPNEIEEFKQRLQTAAETGTTLEMEMRFLNKEGEYIWHLNLASPVKDENGTIKMWIGVTTEIQKIKEEELKKEDFLKMVSHELKTPVTSIKGYVQLLLSMLKEGREDKLAILPLKSSLVRVDVQVLRLTKLIDEILDVSRLKEDKLELHKELINLNELLEETVQDILLTTVNQKIKIISNDACSVYVDKDRLGQVIINLITNAIKYSPIHNRIEVGIHQAENSKVSVSVRDFGIGIDKQDQEKVFDRFYRVQGKKENIFAGFGIGLFIAKEIIIRHDGSISVESEKGAGSVFTFTLPCA